MAQAFGCKFYETSARYRVNVAAPFHQLVREIRRFKMLKIWQGPYRLIWAASYFYRLRAVPSHLQINLLCNAVRIFQHNRVLSTHLINSNLRLTGYFRPTTTNFSRGWNFYARERTFPIAVAPSHRLFASLSTMPPEKTLPFWAPGQSTRCQARTPIIYSCHWTLVRSTH